MTQMIKEGGCNIWVILLALVVVLVGMQLIPVWLMQTNPPVRDEPKWDSPQTRALAKRACFDCHSNETVWPLQARIAPASWLVTLDVLRGRRDMNFSEWSTVGAGYVRADQVREAILAGEMPPSLYFKFHSEARLTEAEQQQLVAGMQASIK